MDLGLKGRTALITGASEGIGRATALRFAQEGANVVACARREDVLQALVDEIEDAGGAIVGVSCDVTDHAAHTKVLEAALERFSGVDILVNNAGRATPRRFLATTAEDWSNGIELNFLSAVRFTQACLPGMVERKWGRIINVSSTTSKLADPYYAIYGATKAAMLNLTKTVSNAFATDGVLCNSILPGITLTPLIDQNIQSAAAKTGKTADEIMSAMTDKWPIPVDRFAEPEEIADAILFLASERANWITGISMPVDGGTIPVVG
jgi:3-oxoacyl-[acyl-carrier protein] reductase